MDHTDDDRSRKKAESAPVLTGQVPLLCTQGRLSDERHFKTHAYAAPECRPCGRDRICTPKPLGVLLHRCKPVFNCPAICNALPLQRFSSRPSSSFSRLTPIYSSPLHVTFPLTQRASEHSRFPHCTP